MRKGFLFFIIVFLLIVIAAQQAAFVYFRENYDMPAHNVIQQTRDKSSFARVYSLGLPRRDRSAVIDFLNNALWEEDPTQREPSEELVEHAAQHALPQSFKLSWLTEAVSLREQDRIVEAAEVILSGVHQDRTLLAYLIDDIDAVAFGLIHLLLQDSHKDVARDLVSACAIAAADPIAYMRRLLQRLDNTVITALWEDVPHVVLVDFDSEDMLNGMHTIVDFQNRSFLEWTLDVDDNDDSGGSVLISAGESEREGDLIVGWREAFMEVSAGMAGLRVYARAKNPEAIELALNISGFFGDGESFNVILRVPVPTPAEDGWLCFDTGSIAPDLFGAIINGADWKRPLAVLRRDASDFAGMQITLSAIGIDIPAGAANKYWLDRIEMYFPRDSWHEDPSFQEPRTMLARLSGEYDPLSEDKDDGVSEKIAALEALGYIDAVTIAPSVDGIVVYDKERAYGGLNFYVSERFPGLYLMDMAGHILHTWAYCIDDPLMPGDIVEFMEDRYPLRAHLFPNGDVLVNYGDQVLLKMDKEGDIIWAKPELGYHHDFRVMDDGTIYVLYREWEPLPLAGPGHNTLVDYIMILDADGNELRRVSILSALERSPYATMLHSADYTDDILHTNSIQVLDGQLSDRLPAFRAGNVLVCIATLSVIAVVDMNTEQVVWAYSGKWEFPHDPKLLPDDTMLIFDNRGPFWHHTLRPASRVKAFDPITREVVWEYTGGRNRPFYSSTRGTAWRLPNDNILITESEKGRVFEVTREKDIVWEYINPDRSGDDQHLIVSIRELIRYPYDYVKFNVSSPIGAAGTYQAVMSSHLSEN